MNAGSHMSCESCQELLVELACDELSAEAAAEARAHARRCERCGPQLERLQRTLKASMALPLLSPSAELEKRIMQAARGALQSKGRAPLPERPEPPRSAFFAWCARIGSWAMSPQVAMASVLVLMVGIGLYALPLGQDAETAGLRPADEASEPAAPALPTPASSGAAAPTPAQPPEREPEGPAEKAAARRERAAGQALNMQARAGSAKGGGHAASEAEGRLRDAPAEPKRQAAPSADSARATPPSKAAARADSPREQKSVASPSAYDDQLAERSAPAAARAKSTLGQAQASPSNAARASSGFSPPPPAAQARAPAAELDLGARQQSAARDKEKKERAPAVASASGDAGALARGIAAAQRGDYAAAQKLLSPLASAAPEPQQRADASLWLARSLRAAGDCARALTYYHALVQPVSAPRAILEEAADCYERTGSAAQASRLRARAAPAAKPTGK